MFAFTRNSFSLTSVAKRRATKRCGVTARDRQRYAISTISRRSERRRLNRSLRRTVSFCQQRARETRFLLGARILSRHGFPREIREMRRMRADAPHTVRTHVLSTYSVFHARMHAHTSVGWTTHAEIRRGFRQRIGGSRPLVRRPLCNAINSVASRAG